LDFLFIVFLGERSQKTPHKFKRGEGVLPPFSTTDVEVEEGMVVVVVE